MAEASATDSRPASLLSGATPAGHGADRLEAAVLAALEATLDALQAPALIIGGRGEVICSNAAARALVGNAVVAHWPPPANTVGAVSRPWEVSPIRHAGSTGWSLAVLRTGDVPPQRRWGLTARQMEVLTLVVGGLTNTGIAEKLGIRRGTIEFHISAIFDKVGVSSRAALIATVIDR